MNKEYKLSLLIAAGLIMIMIPLTKFNANSVDESEDNKAKVVKEEKVYPMPVGEKVVEVDIPKPVVEYVPKKVEKKVIKEEVEAEKKSTDNLGSFNVSWFTSYCDGCSGVTATGVNVKNTIKYQGYNVAASDWNVLPPYSIIEVENYGQFIVLDKGGSIRGKKLDLLVKTKKEAYANGRQNLNVKVIRWGKG